MTENTSGIDPDGWAALLIKKVLYLDPTKPPFVWSTDQSSSSGGGDGGSPNDHAASQGEGREIDEAEERLTQRNLRKLITVKLNVGTLSGRFQIRCIANNRSDHGIALCSETGQLLEIIKAANITQASYRGDRLDLTISKKNDPDTAQRFTFYFLSAKECNIFVRCMDKALKIKASIATDADATGGGGGGDRETKVGVSSNQKLDTINIKDTLVIEGSGFTEGVLTAVYRESAISRDYQQNRSKPLYPFLSLSWRISEEPGANPQFNSENSLDNVLKIEILSAMAGRYILVEGKLFSGSKRVSATKGPILPSVSLSKRLLRTLVAGEGSFPVTLRADDLRYMISNLPDQYSLTFPQMFTDPLGGDVTANLTPSMITCRFVITSKGLSIALPNDMLADKGKSSAAGLSPYISGEDLKLFFSWRECYLTLPDVYDVEQKSLMQSEFYTGYRMNLEFYGADQESWISIQIDFAKSEHRNIVWHYSIFMTVAALASTSTNSLPELLTYLPQFERDLRIGNVQTVQKAFRLLWTALDYTSFKNSVQAPDIFLTTFQERQEREAEISARETNRAGRSKKDHKKNHRDSQTDSKKDSEGHFMVDDGKNDGTSSAVAYEVTETKDKGVALQEWVSSSSEEAKEPDSSDS